MTEILSDTTTTAPLVNWERLQLLMAARQVDVLVATTAPNVTYLSDYWSLSQWSRPSTRVFAIAGCTPHRHVEVILPLSNADLVSTHPRLAPDRVSVYGDFSYALSTMADDDATAEERLLTRLIDDTGERHGTAVEGLVAALRRAGTAPTVAIEGDGLSESERSELDQKVPRARFVQAREILSEARMVKTKREIDLLRASAVATEHAMHATIARVHEGDSELLVQGAFHSSLLASGSLPFLTSVTSGRRTALPNGQATTRRLAHGDLLRFDGGGRHQLYASDLARIAVVGSPSQRQARYYEAVKEGLEEAISLVRPGITTDIIFERAVSAVRAAGIADYARSHCGHGIGIVNYDGPIVAPEGRRTLEAGMVLCLETPYYELGWGGVQAEDTLVVTATGADRFTSFPEQLPRCGTAGTGDGEPRGD